MEEETKNNFEYPILCFGKGRDIVFFRDNTELTVCTKLGKKYYEQAKIVDSKGNEFSIREVNEVGAVGLFFGLDIFLNRKIKIGLQFETKVRRIELNEFKTLLLWDINRNKVRWNSDGEVGYRIKFINEAKTIAEIITKMSGEYFKCY